jgi:hypothetical protein
VCALSGCAQLRLAKNGDILGCQRPPRSPPQAELDRHSGDQEQEIVNAPKGLHIWLARDM